MKLKPREQWICDKCGEIDKGPEHEPAFNGPHVVNLREWAEFVQRLALPSNEEARLYWEKARAAGWFSEGANEFAIYSQDFLERMIREFGQDEEPQLRA